MPICKYYKPEMDELKKLCNTLYTLPECEGGGLLHVVLDDNNYEDEHILYCLKQCEENPDHPSSEIGKTICNKLLTLTPTERAVFDWYWWHRADLTRCKGICSTCILLSMLNWQ